jgi:hypothetical protein
MNQLSLLPESPTKPWPEEIVERLNGQMTAIAHCPFFAGVVLRNCTLCAKYRTDVQIRPHRPHSSLGYLSPEHFVQHFQS